MLQKGILILLIFKSELLRKRQYEIIVETVFLVKN